MNISQNNQNPSKKQLIQAIIFTVLSLSLIVLLFPKGARLATRSAELSLSYDDGAQCYLNNSEIINTLSEANASKYWNKEKAVLDYLILGQNLLACRVSNGDGNRGDGGGYFDAELVVNGQKIVSRGSGDWRYFGEAGKTTPPSLDFNFPRKKWYEIGYNDSSWKTGSALFNSGKTNILGKSPDDAWFRKYFTLDETSLGLSANLVNPVNQQTSVSNQSVKQDSPLINLSLFGCRKPLIRQLGQYFKNFDNIDGLLLNTPTPLITGLVKYGSRVEIYFDDELIGKAVVKEGESTGIANFYFIPKDNIASYPFSLNFHNLKIVARNPFDQSICSSDIFKIKIIPYLAPIIHRLGEIFQVERADNLTIKDSNPLITGLVKFGSLVDVYLDNKYAGAAQVKDGEKSGTANFFFQFPKLEKGNHNLYVIAKKIGRTEIVSPSSQVFNFVVE